MTTRYGSPVAFKAALEHRIRADADSRGMDPARVRQLRIFDRFLARLAFHFGERVVLKGGLALEIRGRARTTRDVDIRLSGDLHDLLHDLRYAGQADLGDHLSFEVDVDPKHPTITGEGVRYDGQRFRVEAKLAGRRYGGRFGVDVGVGDRMAKAPDIIAIGAFFAFAGLPEVALQVYAREVHIAEKLHAWTVPRRRENSRVRDLPDVHLLAQLGPLSAADLRAAIRATFEHRATHLAPDRLPDPPPSWERAYADMAMDSSLPWPTVDEAMRAARRFVDPILSNDAHGRWNPERWEWEAL